MEYLLRANCGELEHRPAVGVRATKLCCAEECALFVFDQAGRRIRPIVSSLESVKHRLSAIRSYFENGAIRVCASVLRRAIKVSGIVFDYPANGRAPIVPSRECIKHRLHTVGRELEHRSAAFETSRTAAT